MGRLGVKDLKGSIGQTLADVLIARHNNFTTWPKPVQELVQAIDGALP